MRRRLHHARRWSHAGPLIEEPYDQSPSGWTAHGKRLLVMDWDANGKRSVSIADIMQPSKREKLALPSDADYIWLSPDNHWLLVDSARSGRREVFYQNEGEIRRSAGTALMRVTDFVSDAPPVAGLRRVPSHASHTVVPRSR